MDPCLLMCVWRITSDAHMRFHRIGANVCAAVPTRSPCARELVLIHLGCCPKHSLPPSLSPVPRPPPPTPPTPPSLLSYRVLVWRALQRQVGWTGAAWPGRGGRDRGRCSRRGGPTCSRWHLVSSSTGGEVTRSQRDVRGREGDTHSPRTWASC